MKSHSIPVDYKSYFEKKGLLLESVLGSGLSGRVFKAKQERLQRYVAIKVFDSPENFNNQKLRKRFTHEAIILAGLQHPSIPVVFSHGEFNVIDRQIPFTIMQFIDGVTLEELLDSSQAVSQEVLLHYFRQILDALAYVHERNFIHRDIKPGNIIVGTSGNCYLIDFSIGVCLANLPGLTRVTGDGKQPGTYIYAAPEVEQGSEPDQRSDLYSLGLVLFKALTRRLPNRSVEDMAAHLSTASGTGMADVFRRACRTDVTQRFQSALEFKNALEMSLKAPVMSSHPQSAPIALEAHEITILEILASELPQKGNVSGARLAYEVEKYGFRRQAAGIGLLSLKRRELIQELEEHDTDGDPYQCYVLSRAGEDWLVQAQQQLNLKSAGPVTNPPPAGFGTGRRRS